METTAAINSIKVINGSWYVNGVKHVATLGASTDGAVALTPVKE